MRTTVLTVCTAIVLVACNQPPEGLQVGIEPLEPLTTDDIMMVIQTEPTDPNNGDNISLEISWSQDGTVRPEFTTATVLSSATSKGEVWEVTVRASDGKDFGPTITDSVTVLNSAPSATATLTPEEPTSSDNLEVTTTTADADGDEVSLTYDWTVNGTAVADQTGATIDASETAHGETWEVTVTPHDGDIVGEAVVASVVIQNVAPVADLAVVTPSLAYEETRLQASASGSDADGDELTWTYTWFVSGGEVKSGKEDWLDGSDFSKGDTVHVEAIANDGFADSEPVLSEGVDILNTAPSIDKVTLTPVEATEVSELTCTSSGYLDVDGDPGNFKTSWKVEGRVISASKTTLTGEFFDKGDEVTCSVVPNDGEADGAAVSSAVVTIGNTAPTLASAAITPATADRTATLRLTLGALDDVDDDSVSVRLDWTVNGSSVSTGSTLAGAFKKGDKVGATATPYDGEDLGKPVVAPAITIKNAPPKIGVVSISPTVAYTNTTVSGSVTATDADSDKLSTTWSWTVNGTSSGVVSSSIDGSKFKKGDKLQAFATVSDGTDTDGPKGSNVVTVLNTKPLPPTIVLTPGSPKDDDHLVCDITKAGSDLDGDKLTYTFDWKRNGGTWTGSTGTTDLKGDTILAKDTTGGDKWQCFAVANDGSVDSTEVSSATVTVASGGVIPGFSGHRGPSLSGYLQCEGYLDVSGGDQVPAAWGDSCMSTKYNKIAIACGASKSAYRYITVKKNVFRDKLRSYPEVGLITSFKDQAGRSFSMGSNYIYATGNDPHRGTSWWVRGDGCNNTALSITVNNGCTWEAQNCFGQGLTGSRYLWVYVAP